MYGVIKLLNVEDVVIFVMVYVESSVFVFFVIRMMGFLLLKFFLVRKIKMMYVLLNYWIVNIYLK